jgi:hypothetical protein
MALPLTVKTETVLVNHLRCLLNRDTGHGIEIPSKEPDPHTQIENPVARRELEAMNTLTDTEETREGSRSIMRMSLQVINVAPKCRMTI